MQLPPRALHAHHTGVEGGRLLPGSCGVAGGQLWGGAGPWVKLGMEEDFICPMRSDKLLSKHVFSRVDGYMYGRAHACTPAQGKLSLSVAALPSC